MKSISIAGLQQLVEQNFKIFLRLIFPQLSLDVFGFVGLLLFVFGNQADIFR